MTPDTLVLGTVALAAALFGPALSELVRGLFLAPHLKVIFDETTPHCIKTFFSHPQIPTMREPVYYFRFRATNEGKTQARICESVLEKLWVYDSAGKPHELPDFAPRNLGFETDQRPVGINPHRRIYGPFGHISSPTYQSTYERPIFVDVPGNWPPDLLRFLLEGTANNAQVNCLVPGKYAIQITLYSENASPETAYFIISWTGKWQDNPDAMFRECTIEQTRKKPA